MSMNKSKGKREKQSNDGDDEGEARASFQAILKWKVSVIEMEACDLRIVYIRVDVINKDREFYFRDSVGL